MPSASSALIRILPNYCATYVPIAIVMIANPIIYTLSSKNVEMAIALPLAQVCIKFFIILLKNYSDFITVLVLPDYMEFCGKMCMLMFVFYVLI